MTLTDFLQPIDLDTHIRMAKADADPQHTVRNQF